MDVNSIKKDCLELIKTAKAAYFTTINSEGYPITRAMFNLRNNEHFPEFSDFFKNQDNEFRIYISTNTSSSKITDIKANSAINIYFCDPDEFKGVMLGGNIEVVEDKMIKHTIWLDWWSKYYFEGVDDPDYTLLCLNPNNLRYYYKLNQVNIDL